MELNRSYCDPPLKNCLPPLGDERICHDEPSKRALGADLWILEATIDVPGWLTLRVPSWSVFVGPMSKRSESFSTETRSIFESTTYSDRERRFQSRTRKDEEGVSVHVLRVVAPKKELRQEAVRHKGQMFCSFDRGQAVYFTN